MRDVNATVADKERKARFLEIYQKLDPKSKIFINGRQFKKSDLLSDNRKLMFEGVGNLQQSKGRSILVNFVVLSDIVIFLQENNQKYMFITPENKVLFFIVNVETSKNIIQDVCKAICPNLPIYFNSQALFEFVVFLQEKSQEGERSL